MREVSLNTRHFLTVASISIEFERQQGLRQRERHIDKTSLKDEGVQAKFIGEFTGAAMGKPYTEDLDTAADNLQHAFSRAAATLPARDIRARRPWTSQRTLDLIQERSLHRQRGDHDNERRLHKEIRKSGKQDRETWLNILAASGGWDAV